MTSAFEPLSGIMVFSSHGRLCLSIIFVFIVSSTKASSIEAKEERGDNRTFTVDYTNSQFLMNGKPFKYVSGELHYFRVPHQYWKDRLHKLKAAGLNAVSTYIEWSQHEPSPQEYVFEGDSDLLKFIELAAAEELYVILRPGPYICAERDFGGYPSWLLTKNPTMKLRTSDPSHTFFITRWFRYLLPKLRPYWYGNGGPVIMVQIENEYGSYPLNDPNYLIWLRDLYRSYIRNAAVLFTTDGSSTNYILKGRIPGVLTTVDFGPGSDIATVLAPLRKAQPKGPLVNSEFYAGWLSYWGENFNSVETDKLVSTLQDLLRYNISFNFYMFHGGTNFGFTAGSGSSKYFQADITSYDYDAPISEAGDLTSKYYAIQDVLIKHFRLKKLNVTSPPKGNYGTVTLKPVVSLFNSPSEMEPVLSEYPITFEQLGQRYGFVSYQTTINVPPKDPSVLQVTVRDRAIVFLDNEEISVLQYTVINETPLPPTLTQGQTLTLLVENMGRRNYQMLSDCTKGIVSNATIDGNLLKDWKILGYPLSSEDISKVEELPVQNTTKISLPAYFVGEFQLPEGAEPLDSYLDLSGWGKGVVFVNEFNLGRFWHIGPQVTLYTPGIYLRPFPAMNKITILELHFTHPENTVTFTDIPILNKTVNSDMDRNVIEVKS